MQLGSVLGTLVATKKISGLKSWSFRVIQPIDQDGQKVGEPLIAVDTVGCREGDQIMWVSSREASVAMDSDWFNPIDAAIVGIVDRTSEVPQGDLVFNNAKENF